MNLPLDVVERICTLFSPKEAAQVIQILDEWDSYLLQYPRSIVYLSNGDFQKFIELNEIGKGDPRDIISEAEGAAGNYDHWFALTFPEIKELEEAMAKEFDRLAKEEETKKFPMIFGITCFNPPQNTAPTCTLPTFTTLLSPVFLPS